MGMAFWKKRRKFGQIVLTVPFSDKTDICPCSIHMDLLYYKSKEYPV